MTPLELAWLKKLARRRRLDLTRRAWARHWTTPLGTYDDRPRRER
jgi:hypothetical protein